ncbi:MBL fold metallo-hydrolase [Xylanimonas ulmi]|nr:MBL fold metallo-hydrolase [Xylanibacterium ulmi]
MTLDGTRSYLLRARNDGVGHDGAGLGVVVDPGPLDDAHLRALAGAGPVGLILVTHRHPDHTAGSERLRELTGAPVRGADPAHCHGGEPLRDGETIAVGALRVEVIATPGHTADSVCLRAAADGADPVVLTGDTVLGSGTTVIANPDGSLAAYLASLDRLERVATASDGGTLRGLPGHGPVVEDLTATVRAYRAHRLQRLGQVREALVELGEDATADDVVARVYAHVPPPVRAAARQSVEAQLAYLRADG